MQAGDHILAIGDIRLDGPGTVDVQEAARLLRGDSLVKLVVMTPRRSAGSEHGSRRLLPPPSPRPSNAGTLRSRTSGRSKTGGRIQRVDSVSTASVASSGSNKSSCVLNSPTPARGRVMLCHPEWVTVTLQIDCRGSYGLALGQSPEHEAPIVLSVESNSPCDR